MGHARARWRHRVHAARNWHVRPRRDCLLGSHSQVEQPERHQTRIDPSTARAPAKRGERSCRHCGVRLIWSGPRSVLPAEGPVIASFALVRDGEKTRAGAKALGSGAIEGIAGPESANNAAAQTSFVPLLTLGLPSGPVGALLLGALIVDGIQPGPTVLTKEPTLFWGLVASMWIGNVMLLALNLPLVGWWAQLANRVPYRFLYPTTVALSCTGIYALNHSTLDLLLTALFGVAGYLLRLRGFEPAPLVLRLHTHFADPGQPESRFGVF